MEFPIIEIVDRFAIAVVKHKMTAGENQPEFDFYQKQMNEIKISTDHQLILKLIDIHHYIWSLENDFKTAKVDDLPLEEIGRRALLVRDGMKIRIQLKNELADLFNDPVKEIKKDHVNETI